MPTLPRSTRLSSREDFERVFSHGRSIRSGQISVRFLPREPDNEERLRIGYVITRRHVRTAVRRNQLRRLLRESYRLIRHEVEASVSEGAYVDLLIIWNGHEHQAQKRNFGEIRLDVTNAMKTVIRLVRTV